MSMDRGQSLLALLMLTLPAIAPAAEFTIDSTLDAVDATPGDGICATAAQTPACSLRAAIQEANALEGTDRIVVPAGTYALTLAGADEDLSASGDLDVSSELLLAGSDPATTLIESDGSDRLLDVLDGGIASVTGLTLRGGGNVNSGGGVRNSGVLAMQACVVDGNGGSDRVVLLGGGIANSGVLTLSACVLSNNTVGSNATPGSLGGGLYNGLTVFINASRLSANRALGNGNSGGGIYTTAPAITQLSTSSIEDNSAGNGGGIAMAGGTLYINSSAVVANLANGSGAQAGRGGGLRVNGGNAWLVNTTLSGNAANGDGGGLQVASGGADLRNVTVTGNSADQDANASGNGGGLAIAGTATAAARNSIIAGNLDAGGGSSHPDCSGTLASSGYLWLLDAVNGCALQSAAGDVIGVDPQLGALADNGGLTMTHALADGSPAIDAGHPDGCVGNTIPDGEAEPVDVPLVLDQRQRLRPVDGDADEATRCDVGAFEFIPEGLVPERVFRDGFEDVDGG